MLRECVWMTWRAGEATWVPMCMCEGPCTYALTAFVCVCVCVCVYGSVQMWSDVFFSFTKGATSGHPVSLQHKQSYFWAHLSWSLQFWRGKSKVSLLTLPIFYFFKSNLRTLMLLGLVIAILCLFNSAHTLIWMKRIFLLDTFSFWVHGFKLAWFYQLFRNYGFSNNLKSNRTISSKSERGSM